MRFVVLAAGALLTSVAAAQTGGLPGTTWRAEDIRGGGVIDTAQSTISFEDGNVINGDGACNRYRGAVTVDGENMQFGQIASTKKLCPPALMDQETKFFAALEAARTFVLDGPYLRIRDEKGAELLRLTQIKN
ncbi:MAG: META domain-containing protein [Hyphomicrobiales bacterium]|nr:META domain-containing protein [Hyphomicrobiales bacterium]